MTTSWDTTTNILKYNGAPAILKGISLTSTEYIASQYTTDSYYDFTNNVVSDNLIYVVEELIKMTTNSSSLPITIPCLRIPLCADYWLFGSATFVNNPPTVTDAAVNVVFTASQYQQAIVDIINYVYSNMNGNHVTFNLDLHWNYSTEQPKQSFNGTSGNNFNSGQQLAMAGVFVSGNGNNGSLPDNTISFWTSIVSIFGTNSTSTLIPNILKENIFFELYNEPFTDQLVNNAYDGYTSDLSYTSGYNIYVNGGQAYLNSTDNLFSFTGMGQIYNEIRYLGAQNLLIVGGADSFSYMIFNNGAQWSYPYDGNPAPNTINNTYNCFTKLQSAIVNGTVPISSYTNTNYNGSYPVTSFNNIIANLHPYCGLYSGASKAPGYYNNSYSGNNQPGFGQIVSALQNPALSSFYISFPNISTEFGQYDLPWSAYNSNNIILNGSAYAYNLTNLNYPSNPPYIVPSGVTLGTPYYIGYWINSIGEIEYGPPIIGYLNDFNQLNVSFTVWAMRPNSGGSGNGIGCNPNTTGFGWGATQPDTFSGGFSYPGTDPDGSASCSTTNGMFIISSSNQLLNSTFNTSTGNYNNNGANNLNGYQGPDFNYLFTNYFYTN